ncbi:3-isopropylmalate dehydratase small subunit [Flaviaesturariibacter amylovorans]|uniref:3-isopropylmalate dehydratase small subunit n=1 Tax=Flaviaesturariibacter amylovorans TaxID=1084520 RepID=A0ABP8H0D0_9BACT
MQPINRITGTFVPLPQENVDTDQIIPARFLKATTREGFGDNLFRDWRYVNDDERQPRASFVLNDPRYSGSILVAGKNFGCGSSREHAAWALCDYGFRVVVSSYFADIFRGNALNNGLLPVQVSEAFLEQLFALESTATLTVDLREQVLRIDAKGASEPFFISAYKKECLLNGYDDIDFLISLLPEIATFEQAQAQQQPV